MLLRAVVNCFLFAMRALFVFERECGCGSITRSASVLSFCAVYSCLRPALGCTQPLGLLYAVVGRFREERKTEVTRFMCCCLFPRLALHCVDHHWTLLWRTPSIFEKKTEKDREAKQTTNRQPAEGGLKRRRSTETTVIYIF